MPPALLGWVSFIWLAGSGFNVAAFQPRTHPRDWLLPQSQKLPNPA